jgi:hypothetical protein
VDAGRLRSGQRDHVRAGRKLRNRVRDDFPERSVSISTIAPGKSSLILLIQRKPAA